jgi:methyl-accepting chemotaxis protein
MAFFKSLRFKLVACLLLATLIPLLGLAFFQLNQFNKVLSVNIQNQEVDIADTNVSLINIWIDGKVSQITESLKAHPEFAEMTVEQITQIVKYINENDLEVESTIVADKLGELSAATNINISDREYFKNARDTKNIAVSDIIINKSTGKKQISIAVPILDKSNTFKGIIVSLVSVETLGNYLGKVKLANTGYAYLLSRTGEIIYHPNADMVGKAYSELVKNPIKDKAFKESILKEDKGNVDYPDDDGSKNVAGFSKVERTGWKVVVTAPSLEVFADLDESTKASELLIVVAALFVILLSVLIANFISNPIKLAAKHLNILANADFTQEIGTKVTQRGDEIGTLGKSMNSMSESIKSVVNQVIDEANRVEANIANSSLNLAELSAKVQNVTATTQEMSASMQETAATTETMRETSLEIESAVESITNKVQNGSTLVEEISLRAQNLKNNATSSQQAALELRNNVDADMRSAIQQSKAVQQINVLANAILDITSRTNLLALNAAIEAARAGEAGKGFSVVATEIRKLAESSKQTVNEIQDVTRLVISSVQSLTDSSEKALEFIDKTVINDYKTMVHTGDQYYMDAESIQEMVMDFSATAEQLLASIQNMVQAINEVSTSTMQGAQGTQDIAENTLTVMQEANKVTELMQATQLNSQKLIEIVSQFKV